MSELAGRLQSEITGQIQRHLDNHLATPILIKRINANTIHQGLLDPRDQQAMEHYFWEQLQLFDTVSSIYFGTSDGGLVDAGREGSDHQCHYVIAR